MDKFLTTLTGSLLSVNNQAQKTVSTITCGTSFLAADSATDEGIFRNSEFHGLGTDHQALYSRHVLKGNFPSSPHCTARTQLIVSVI